MRDFHGLTQTETILQMLRDAGERGVPNYLLTEVSLQYNARIYELRHRGYDIQRERVRRNGKASGTYLYFLRGPRPIVAVAPPEKIKIHQPGALFDMPRERPKQMMDPT